MKNYKKLIFKERRYSFRHEREAKEEKIIYVPYEVSNPGHNNGGTREKARGGLEPPTHSPPPHSNPWGFSYYLSDTDILSQRQDRILQLN